MAALVGAVLLVSCGSSGGGPSPGPSATPSPTPVATLPATPTASPTAVPTAAARTQVSVYFLQHEKVQPVARTVDGAGVAAAAVRALLAGPTVAERAAGLSTTVPTGVSLRSLAVAAGVATVDLTGRYASGGGSLSMTARLAQVVFTLTRFPSVSSVRFRLDGAPVTVFGGEGIVLSHPSTRADFEELAPAILVETPLRGDAAPTPLVVSGTADVFEAVLQLELRTTTGTVLLVRRVQATSGSGTRGTFSASLPFTVRAPTSAVLTGFVYSAKDGARQDVVSVPVRLLP
ncbi:MAG: GerMN domain-containing protein [Mycobacteriales bacterium]